jgi:hypothetical protein
MKAGSNIKLALLKALLAVLLAAAALPAAGQAADDRWRISVMPYLWFPTIDGTLRFRFPAGNPTVDVKANPGDYLDELELALLLAVEARKGRWLLFSDVTYMKLSDTGSSVRAVDFNVGPGPVNPVSTTLNSGTQTDVYTTIWTVAAGYNLVQDPKLSLDLFGGGRYLRLKAKTNWQLTATVTGPGPGQVFPASGSVEEKGDIWDAIIGVKGRVKLGDGKWYVPYYLDAGTGGSEYTWQAQTGIGYAFKWGDLVLGYRYVAWGQDDKAKVIQDIKLYGFGLGGIFHF